MARLFGTLAGAAAIALAAVCAAPSAQALTMQECSAKYKAAQEAGTLGGLKWNDFRKQECGGEATTAAAPAAAAPAAARAPAAATGGVVFPTAVSPKYQTLSPGKARMQTCLDQYNANKASGKEASLKWIEKGGGYYSECNKRLSS